MSLCRASHPLFLLFARISLQVIVCVRSMNKRCRQVMSCNQPFNNPSILFFIYNFVPSSCFSHGLSGLTRVLIFFLGSRKSEPVMFFPSSIRQVSPGNPVSLQTRQDEERNREKKGQMINIATECTHGNRVEEMKKMMGDAN